MNVVQHFTILPCDIGAELFIPCMSGDIIRKRVQGFLIRANKILVITEYDTQYQIGVDAFLTYPEALNCPAYLPITEIERTDILDHVPFSDDQFYRILQNCSIDLKMISTPAVFDGGRYDICASYIDRTVKDVSQLMDLAGQLHDRFHDQFKHNICIRRVCPNPNCKSKYAYFYEDFLYCPKCGTELITTRDDRKGEEK